MEKKKKYQDGGTIKIRDNRKTNIVTGLPLSSKSRKHANIPTELVQVIIDSAKKYKVNPYTALAIGLQESNYHPDHQKNPFMLGNYNPQGHIIDESMQFMAEKEKYARGLGKKKEEDVIQAYNGYGSLVEQGNMYGIDTNETPIEMTTNPVYGKTVKQLRDSVIMQNSEIRRLVEGKVSPKYKEGGVIDDPEFKYKNRFNTRLNIKEKQEFIKWSNSPELQFLDPEKSLKMKKLKKILPNDPNAHKYGGKISISDLNNLTDEEVYSLGGWLNENAIPLLSTVAGGVMTATGVGAGAGVGLLASGIGGLVGNATADEPEEIVTNPTVMPRTVGKNNMTPNVMSFKKGGGLQSISKNKAKEMLENPPHGKKLSTKQEKTFRAIAHGWNPSYESGGNMNDDLMQIKGPSHEQGGVQFTNNAELEGGETVRNNVVNSDSIIIDNNIAEIYGLPSKAVGKSVAAYSKMVDKQFKGREGDPFAMKSREISMNNITKMSDDLGKLFNGGNQYQTGGEIEGDDQWWINKGYIKDRNNRWVLSPTQMEERSGNYKNPNNINVSKANPEIPISKQEEIVGTVGTDKNKLRNNFKLRYLLKPDDYNQWEKGQPTFKKGVGWVYPNQQGNTTQVPEASSVKGKFEYTPESDTKGFVKGKATGTPKPTIPYENIYDPNNTMYGKITHASDYNDADYIMAEDKKQYSSNPISKLSTKNLDVVDNTPNKLAGTNLKPSIIKPKGMLRHKLEGLTENTNWGNVATTALGVAPLALGAFQAARAAKERPDKVSLGRIHYDPMNPEFIDPQYQLDQVRESFATGNEQMSQVSKKDMLRRRIQSATEESKARSGVLGSVQAANTQMLNQSRQFNTQNKFRSDALNAELGIQEENINAANKGAWETNRDYQLNNLGTMAGEYARDLRMEGAQERYRDRWFKAADNMFAGQNLDPNTLGWNNTGEGLTAPPLPSSAHVYGTDLKVKPYVPMQQPSPITYPPTGLEDNNDLQYGSFRWPKAKLGWINRNINRNG